MVELCVEGVITIIKLSWFSTISWAVWVGATSTPITTKPYFATCYLSQIYTCMPCNGC